MRECRERDVRKSQVPTANNKKVIAQGWPTFWFHAPIFFTLNLMRHIKHPFLFSSLKQGRAISMKSKNKGLHFTPSDSGAPRILAKGGHNRGSGGETPSCQRIFTVFIWKNAHFSTPFLSKKGVRWVQSLRIMQKYFRSLCLKSVDCLK